MPRTADRDERLAKRCNNTCPICWMPLNVGRGVQAEKWKVVQMTFKAKPAFSLKKRSADFSRPVLVFGVSPFTGIKPNNYEGCHYVHYSNVGNNHEFSGLWEMGLQGPNAEHCTVSIPNEPVLKDAFYTALFTSSRSVFELAFAADSSTSVLLDKIVNSYGVISGAIGGLHLFVKRTFMGCGDCNNKMTISEFIEPLFGLLFDDTMYDPAPRKARRKAHDSEPALMEDADNVDDPASETGTLSGVSKRKKRTPRSDGFDSEMMLHYIMLCGLLKTDDQTTAMPDNMGKRFKIQDNARRNTWLLRCIMMWCALQIVFCNWKMAALYDGLRHHTNYIYRGVIDFYLSMWFFALYSVCTHERARSLQFDEFHYYYTSMMPFFSHARNGYNGAFNLCALVLTENNIGSERFPGGAVDRLASVNQTMNVIFNNVTSFWNREMESICFSIHGLARGGPLDHFFITFDRVEARRNRVTNDAFDLGVQAFCDELTPFWYWFHFKYTTMRVIEKTSREYLTKPDMPIAAKPLWLAWCRTFDSGVVTLGVRMYLKQKTELIRLRALGYSNKS